MAALAVGCGPGAPDEQPASTSAVGTLPATSSSSPTNLARYLWDFDGVEALAGWFEAEGIDVGSHNGGALETIRPGVDGSARAIRFPSLCMGESCPRVVLSVVDSRLDPGERPFAFGAAVLVELDELSPERGSNLVQKGLSSSAQWKLQIDGGGEGYPSCVLRTADGESRVMVTSTVGVADGRWHRIECRRTADQLLISVDAALAGSATVPVGYSVEPAEHPVTVGGNGPYVDNDQFHGALDDVFVEFGPW